uniref:Immunoglobulin V-set domain-containing protein n=1 Tax=Poecilia latipinna TaxID=48699 RepID=A0A3B3V407_9TELE
MSEHLMLPTLSFAVPFLCLLLLMKDKVDSVDLLAPEEVTTSPGGLVKVACQYDLQFKERPKYWCKGSVYELCRVLVKTTSRTQHDRYFIADDRAAGVFTVTMTSLVESDEDKYWCVISRYGRNEFLKIPARHLGKFVIVSFSFLFSGVSCHFVVNCHFFKTACIAQKPTTKCRNLY